jgi:tripartite-type tricarboxylate transporter receptor subunit TctC
MRANRRGFMAGLGGAVLLAILAIGFDAQSGETAEYPIHPIRIIVPWPAGGPSDAVARVLAQEVSGALNQSVIVDNKAGATGTIGSEAAAKSAPDGYTLVVANSASHALAKISNPKLTYDPMVDFRPVIEYGNYPVAIMAAASLPAKTLAEFVAFSKASKDGILVGIPGAGSVSHIYGQLLAQKTGARLTFIPYRGDAPARVDLLAGNIQAIAATPDFGLIAEGKARLIGSTGTQRWPQAPDVLTFAEAGYPDLVAFISWGFAAPAGTPDNVINNLNAAINRALLIERVKNTLVDNAYFVTGGPPEVLWSALRQQISQFDQMARAGTIKFE